MMVPQHDELAEQSALGAAMLSRDALDDVFSVVQPRDFYIPKHEVIAGVLLGMMAEGSAVDVVTVGAEIRRRGLGARAGDDAYLHSLVGAVVTASNASYYAGIIREKAILRRLALAGEHIRQMGFSSEGDVPDLLERARGEVEDAAGLTAIGGRSVGDVVPSLEAQLTEDGGYVPSPWPTLNRVIGGFRPGAVYVVAARPGAGKTVVASQCAVALSNHGYVAFSSLEMSAEELVARIVADEAGIPVGHIKNRQMDSHDWALLEQQRARIAGLRISVDDRASATSVDVRAHARAVSRKGRLAGVIVDYLQLMSSPASRLDRHLQVAEFSRQLKILARDLAVPVIALSQLNRQVESRVDPVPRLSDLRESGAIEQDADVVILLRREEMPGHDPKRNPKETLWMHVAKNRHGAVRDVPLWWRGEYSRVEEWPDGYEAAFAGTV